jgi:hypothetical protein
MKQDEEFSTLKMPIYRTWRICSTKQILTWRNRTLQDTETPMSCAMSDSEIILVSAVPLPPPSYLTPTITIFAKTIPGKILVVPTAADETVWTLK